MSKSIKLNDNTFWSGEICDMGTANGGHYIRFANGIQICTKAISVGVTTTQSLFGDNTGYQISLGAQPANFKSLWVEATSSYSTSDKWNASCIYAPSTTNMGSCYIHRPWNTRVWVTGTLYVTAIGTWK